METLSSDLVGVLSLSGGLGFAMVMLARWYGMLEQPSTRRCPSCGRLVSRRERCQCSSHGS
jgi:hypothetical protein